MDPGNAAIGVASDYGLELPLPLGTGKDLQAVGKRSLYQVAGQRGSFIAPKLRRQTVARIGLCPYFEDLEAAQPSAMASAAALPRLETPSLANTDDT